MGEAIVALQELPAIERLSVSWTESLDVRMMINARVQLEFGNSVSMGVFEQLPSTQMSINSLLNS